jgi:hypothetical protein
VLRRYEMYSISPDAAPADVRQLAEAFRQCGRFIPEVLDSAIGTNLSDAPIRLVWEHAYASPEAYQHYMVQAFHACILDRYLLADSPERIVTSNDFGAGLVGYACDTPVYRLASGVRRLVLLDLAPDASHADVAALADEIGRDAPGIDGLRVSVVAENTMASAWMDGVTPITARPRWSHVWEQGWDDLAGYEAYRDGTSALADAERRDWEGAAGGVVRGAASVHYKLLPAD